VPGDCAGRHSKHCAKVPTHVALVGKPRCHGDFGNRHRVEEKALAP
jgi:hypothetical protein